MIDRGKIIDSIASAIRDVSAEKRIKVSLDKAIILIDQGILENTLLLKQVCGMPVYSAGYISYDSEAIIAFPEEATQEEMDFAHYFKDYLQLYTIMDT